MKHIVLIGAPYSGKGTQSNRLSNKFSLKHISVGDLLRQEIIAETELGGSVAWYVTHGEIVPNELIIKLVRSKISKAEGEVKFIFDGIPRTLPQTSDFEKIIKEFKLQEIVYIVLNVSHNTLVSRANMRAKMLDRIDDKDSRTVQNRIKTFEEITKPVIDFYVKKGIAKIIDGEESEDIVFNNICKLVTS